jgi:hypothetical protein
MANAAAVSVNYWAAIGTRPAPKEACAQEGVAKIAAQ